MPADHSAAIIAAALAVVVGLGTLTPYLHGPPGVEVRTRPPLRLKRAPTAARCCHHCSSLAAAAVHALCAGAAQPAHPPA